MRVYLALSVLLTLATPVFSESTAPKIAEDPSMTSKAEAQDQTKEKKKETKETQDSGNSKENGAAKDVNSLSFMDSSGKGSQFGGLSNRSFDGESKNKSAALGDIPYSPSRAKFNHAQEAPSNPHKEYRPPVGHHKPQIQQNEENQSKQQSRRRAYSGKYKKPHHESEDIRSLPVRQARVAQEGSGSGGASGKASKGRSGGGSGKGSKGKNAAGKQAHQSRKDHNLDDDADELVESLMDELIKNNRFAGSRRPILDQDNPEDKDR